MEALAITSITNFILASELFFLAGLMVKTPKARFSAAWFWSGAMFALASSALIGGIDHGFVEPAGLSRYFIQRPNWIVVGAATFCMLLATARQFFPPRWQRPALILGTIEFIVFAIAVLLVGDFRIVIVNYVPVMLLLLLMSVRGLKDGTGSWQMIAGVLCCWSPQPSRPLTWTSSTHWIRTGCTTRSPSSACCSCTGVGSA